MAQAVLKVVGKAGGIVSENETYTHRIIGFSDDLVATAYQDGVALHLPGEEPASGILVDVKAHKSAWLEHFDLEAEVEILHDDGTPFDIKAA